MAFPPRLYGASVAFSRRAIYLTVLLWRLQGVVTAFMALAWSFYRVFKGFSQRSLRSRGASTASNGVYDKNTKKDI